MIRALLYLRLTSLKNMAVTRTLRLREPKYLLGALGTAAYFYFFVFRRLAMAGGSRHSPPFDPIMLGASVGMLLMSIGWVIFAWIAPSEKASLRFSPAEIAFLFPAPATRRTLVHYNLLSSQLKILLSAVLLGALWSRHGFSWESAAISIGGWWILLSVAELHRTAANLTYGLRRERGGSMALSRALALGIVVSYLAAVALVLWREAPRWPAFPGTPDGRAVAAYVAAILNTGGIRWLLFPFRIVAGPFLAAGGRAFLAAIGPAVLVLAAHYIWIMRLDVSFAEGSMSLAEKRAQTRAARAAGSFGAPVPQARRAPFRLAPGGRPEGAFLWKNLLSTSGSVNWRALLIGGIIVIQSAAIGIAIVLATGGGHGHKGHPLPLAIAAIAGMLSFYTLLAGPQLARQDLRSDLLNIDILKTYPLAGWQVVLGETLAPIALLSGALWILLLTGATALILGSGGLAWGSPGLILTGAACALCVVPPVCALELLVPNAAMMILPAWHQATRSRTGGIEMIGQRMIFVLGQQLAVVLLLLPAVIAVPILIFATQWIVGPVLALLFATAVALAIIGGEVWCGVWWLGARFEKLDLSQELRP